MTLPTFLIIGSARAGTTSLYNYLDEHPGIYMSPLKETRFFAFDFESPTPPAPLDDPRYGPAVKTLADYTALFDGVTTETAIGEASPHYMSTPDVAPRIKRHIPAAKIIAILRHPAEQVYSLFSLWRREGRERCKQFEHVLDDNDRRDDYLGPSYYATLKPYFDAFDAAQIKILLFDDYKANTLRAVQEIYAFVGVDAGFEPDFKTGRKRYRLS